MLGESPPCLGGKTVVDCQPFVEAVVCRNTVLGTKGHAGVISPLA